MFCLLNRKKEQAALCRRLPSLSALEPWGTVLRQPGSLSRLREGGGRLRSPFARPRFPASRTIADARVSNGRQQRIDQRPALLGLTSRAFILRVSDEVDPELAQFAGDEVFGRRLNARNSR